MGILFIIGYMASGKTTFGSALAAKTGRRFIDLDEEIEKASGQSISDLINNEGLDNFREMERKTLQKFATEKDAIISCGGGTPCYFDNMELMNRLGTTLLLEASPSRIAERVLAAGPTRPLLAELKPEELKSRIESHLQERSPWYEKALLRFDSEHLENEKEISESVERFLALHPEF